MWRTALVLCLPISLAAQAPVEFLATWGWNRAAFAKSDIRLQGTDYDLVIKSVQARDKPEPFSLRTYFGPTTVNLPQTAAKFAVTLRGRHQIGLRLDHLKYLLVANQKALVSGKISRDGSAYAGNYSNTTVALSPDFIQLEHSDGLNLLSLEYRRWWKTEPTAWCQLSAGVGAQSGAAITRTRCVWLGGDTNDVYKLSGMNAGALVGLRMVLFQHFAIGIDGASGTVILRQFPVSASGGVGRQNIGFGSLTGYFGWQWKWRRREAA